MRYRWVWIVLAVAGGLAACAPASRFPEITDEMAAREAAMQRELAVGDLIAADRRLARVAHPILVAASGRCDETTRLIGVSAFHDGMLGREYEAAFEAVAGVGPRLTVTAAPAAYLAGVAGLERGDVLLEISGEPVPEGDAGFDVVHRVLAEGGGDVRLLVERDGAERVVTVPPVLGCRYGVSVMRDDAVNAFADGSSVKVTTGMLRFVDSDDELALIVGHEVAHNTETHVAMKQGNAIVGGLVGLLLTGLTGVDMTQTGMQLGAGAFSQDFESEADYVGTYYAAAAGYDVGEAAKLWRRMAAAHPDAIHLAGSTHPSTAKRFVAIEQAVAEVEAKQAAGAPLVPEARDDAGDDSEGEGR